MIFQPHTIDTKQWFKYLVVIVLVTIVLTIVFDSFLPWLLPISLLGFGWILDDFRKMFYLLFILLPFTIEFFFDSAGIGMDLPSEPIMIILAGFTLFVWIKKRFAFDTYYVRHIILFILTAHIAWIMITAVNSTYFVISLKFFLSKQWYILPFLILPLLFAEVSNDLIKAYKLLVVFTFISLCIVLVRHAMEDFSFASSYDVVRPFFRNHVAYAAILVVCLPFVWAFYRIKVKSQQSSFLLLTMLLLFIVAIYFSYTRAAIISMIIAVGAYFIIRWRWVVPALLISSIVALVGIIYLSWNNKYLDLTPNFERTITHTEFDNLVEATYKLEDISTMERLYRWIAGVEMIKDKFWMGFGPGTFYNNYQLYSISRFQTYVSDNPDKSGIHNYYLMTWVDQGLIGFLIYLALCFGLIIECERVYHRATDAYDKYYIMATGLAFIIIFSMCLINDLIETDKVGPFFFFNIAILLFYSRKYKSALGAN
jgi:O-antigen ligase